MSSFFCCVAVSDSSLLFVVEGHPAFELPLHLIAQAVAQSRNEVALELHLDEQSAQQMESLVEMRVYIPDDAKQRGDGDDEDGSDAEAEDGEEKETPAQVFARELQLRGDLGLASSTPLAQFEKLLFSVPRGRYDVELFPTFLKLASQTYTYKIAYKNVNKMFLFDLSDSGQHLFVIGLNPPVRQGRTAYPYLVVQFDSSEYLEQKFPQIDAATAEEKVGAHRTPPHSLTQPQPRAAPACHPLCLGSPSTAPVPSRSCHSPSPPRSGCCCLRVLLQYGGLIKPEMRGPSHDVVTRVFKALMRKKVLIPSSAFNSPQSGHCVQASYKANEGHLFMLEKSFFFVKKPPMHLRHASITSIEFDRMSSANKRFGMRVTTNEHKANEYTFTNIARDEFDRILAFLRDKGLHLITNGEDGGAGGEGGSSSRRRAAAGAGDEDDPYLNRIRADAEEAEGVEGGEGGGRRGGEDSDSDNDEDFTVASDDDASDDSADEEDDDPLDSEVDESDLDDSARRRGKSARSKKKARAAMDDGSSGDASDGGAKRAAGSKVAKAAGKGRLTGYLLYSKEHRPQLVKDNPALDFGAVTQLIGAQWKEETAEVQAEFKRRAAQLNEGTEEGATQPADGAKERGLKRKKPEPSNRAAGAEKGDQEMKEEAKDGAGQQADDDVMEVVKEEKSQ